MLTIPVDTSCPREQFDAAADATSAATIDWELITRQVMRGDPDAFAVFYQLAFTPMFREAKRALGRDEATALDIVQDAMLKAIRCIKPLETESAVIGWSRTVAKSVAYDWLRKRARRREVELVIPLNESSEVDGAVPDLARVVWLEEELNQLPSETRHLIGLRYRLGWSLREIGNKLGLKTGAVDGRIRRTVEILKQKAERQFHDE